MGNPSITKNYTITVYPDAFLTVEEISDQGLFVPVVLIDITYVTKYLSGDYASGEEMMLRQVCPEIDFYYKRGCELLMMLFDRHSPINKYEEHQKRIKSTIPTPTPTDAEQVLSIISNTGRETIHDILKQFVARPSSSSGGGGGYPSNMTMQEIQEHEAKKSETLRLEAMERYSHADPAALLVLTDLIVPRKDVWSKVIANHQLRKEIMHYLTCKLVYDPTHPTLYQSGVYKKRQGVRNNLLTGGYYPPVGKVLCIHGGQTEKPVRRLEPTSQAIGPDSSLVTITTSCVSYDDEGNETSSYGGGGGATRVKRTIGNADQFHPPNVIKNIGEGETACMYYSLLNLGRDQLIISSDGDCVMLALIASKYRMGPGMQNFVNKVYVLLKVPGGGNAEVVEARGRSKNPTKAFKIGVLGTAPPKKTSMCPNLYVDINALYLSIKTTGPFARCVDPIASYVGIMSMMGNDFIKGFAPGLTTGMDTVHQVPWFVLPMMKRPERYRDMIKITLKAGDTFPSFINPAQEAFRASESSVFSTNEGVPLGSRESIFESSRRTHEQFILEGAILDTTKEYEATINLETFIEYTHECYHYKCKDIVAVRNKIQKALQAGKKARRTTTPEEKDLGIYRNVSSAFEDNEDIPLQNRRTKGVNASNSNSSDEENENDEFHFDIYTECIREHLASSAKNKMMTDQEIKAFSRRIKWLLEYWSNSYIKDCTYPNPCETFNGKSYYGWERSPEDAGACRRCNSVSEDKPTTKWIPSWLSTFKNSSSSSNTATKTMVPTQHIGDDDDMNDFSPILGMTIDAARLQAEMTPIANTPVTVVTPKKTHRSKRR